MKEIKMKSLWDGDTYIYQALVDGKSVLTTYDGEECREFVEKMKMNEEDAMSKNELKCKDCCYHWKEEWEDYPSCHWEIRCPDDKAPCEYDSSDYYGDDGDEECDFEEDFEWALREQREWEMIEDWYRPSSSARDYGPSNPWNAPGMSVSDFI